MPKLIAKRYLSPWQRLRYQVGGCVLFAAILPYLARIAMIEQGSPVSGLNATLIGTLVAIVAGSWLLRSVSSYPGVEGSSYILPSLSASYALLLLAFVVGRIEYNRATLLAGYIVSVGWYYVVFSRVQRVRRLRIGLLPFGDVSALRILSGIEWETIASPTQAVSECDAIAVDLRADLPDIWERRLTDYALSGMPVYHSKHLHESISGRVEIEQLSENSFGSLTPLSAYMTFKHMADGLIAVIALVVLWPMLLLVGLIIRLSSPGPALFRQERIGYQGRPFTVLKFRTMVSATELPQDIRSAAITQENDQRVTRLGRFLRRSRIDELPQLINVLKGEMSLIGPRPEATVLSRWYEAEIPFYKYRHTVRPGIAGWAQVCQGHVAHVADVTSKLHYDFFYIRNYSPWMDLLIVARTIRTMISGFGAR